MFCDTVFNCREDILNTLDPDIGEVYPRKSVLDMLAWMNIVRMLGDLTLTPEKLNFGMCVEFRKTEICYDEILKKKQSKPSSMEVEKKIKNFHDVVLNAYKIIENNIHRAFPAIYSEAAVKEMMSQMLSICQRFQVLHCYKERIQKGEFWEPKDGEIVFSCVPSPQLPSSKKRKRNISDKNIKEEEKVCSPLEKKKKKTITTSDDDVPILIDPKKEEIGIIDLTTDRSNTDTNIDVEMNLALKETMLTSLDENLLKTAIVLKDEVFVFIERLEKLKEKFQNLSPEGETRKLIIEKFFRLGRENLANWLKDPKASAFDYVNNWIKEMIMKKQ